MNRVRLDGTFDLADSRILSYAKHLNEFQPVYLNGYSSWIGRFAEVMENENADKYCWIPLKGIVATSEILTDYHRQLAEKVFRSPIIDEYGASEIGLIAISCPQGGFHTVPENNYLELLPVETGVHSEGIGVDRREVVVTDFYSHAMPFIRYKVNDIVEMKNALDVYCPCGRTSRLIGPVQGRSTKYILTPEGELRSGMIYDYAFKMSLDDNVGIRCGCARQTSLSEVRLYIVKDQNFSEEFFKFVEKVTREHVSPSISLTYEFVDDLPRTSTGKVQSFATDLDIDTELAKIRTNNIGT